MSAVRRFLESIGESLASAIVYVVVTLSVGYGLILAIKDRFFKRPEAIEREFEEVRAQIAKAKAEHEAKVAVAEAQIDQKAAEDKKEDSVTTANRFVLEHWGKK